MRCSGASPASPKGIVVAALLAVAAVGLAVGVPVPGGAAAAVDLQVLESTGVAAVAGAVTRLPAESAGGAVFSSTALNLDKARGVAAGFTGGNLVEIFFGTSSEDYRNPTLARSQFPPTASEKEEGSAETGQANGAGVTGVFTTKSTGQPSSTASATAQTLAGTGLTITGGHSESTGAVDADEAVITETRATSSSVLIGDIVKLSGVRSLATARVARDGTPEATVQTSVAEITVNGVPARLSSDGLQLAEQPPFGAKELADFNAGLAQLKERGITLAGVPTQLVKEPGRARAVGAVAVVRYQIPVVIPNSIGNDEEILLGQVVAESIAVRRPDTGPLPELDLGAPLPPAGDPVVAPPAPGSGTASPVGGYTLPGPGRPGRPSLTIGTGTGPSETALPDPAPSGDVATPPPAPPADTDPFASGVAAATATASDRVRSGYGSFILAALAGAALFMARQRTRLV
jgi:hypothetical protein